MALSFDLLTALAVSGIAAILAIYGVVVYKKGWLKRESRADQAYYLCPSQKCRRVFKKPVWLTDLSHTPPVSYQACPHCGMNIQVASSISQTTAMPEVGLKSPTSADGSRGPQGRPLFTRREAMASEPEQGHEQKLGPRTDGFFSQAETASERATKPLVEPAQTRNESQQKTTEPPKRNEDRGAVESQRKCSHFFGYVKTLPKNTPIPDECLWCSSIVDCLSHEPKAKTEAYVSM